MNDLVKDINEFVNDGKTFIYSKRNKGSWAWRR